MTTYPTAKPSSPQATYHRDVFLPESLRERLPKDPVPLRYSGHALDEARKDRVANLPDRLTVTHKNVVEVTADGDRVVKLLVRVRLDSERDLCLVVRRDEEGDPGTVVTAWVNRRNDRHRTLDRARYATH